MNNNAETGIGILMVIVAICAGILWLFGVSFGFEDTGTVTYSDCRQVITIPENNWRTYVNHFICSYEKTSKGVIMDGECAHIVNDSSFFGNSHTCATAYIYEKKQQGSCTDPAHPYIGYDDMCYTTPQGGEAYIGH